MAGSPPQPTHKISYVLKVADQNFLVLTALTEGADEVVVRIDEVLADHLIGAQNIELRVAN